MKKIPAVLFMPIIVGIVSISIFSQEEVVILVPNVFAQDYEIPAWIKNNAGWWATDQIDDSSFLQGIQYLIQEGIMIIPPTESSADSDAIPDAGQRTDAFDQHVPSWIKSNAGWWATDQIDDSSFLQGIQYLVQKGIIVV